MGSYEWIEDIGGLITDIQPDSILSRTLFKNSHVKAVLFAFDEGQSLSEHQAAQPALLQIVSGEATLTLGDQRYEAKAGSYAYMQPGLKHSVLAKTPLTMLLLLLAKPEAT